MLNTALNKGRLSDKADTMTTSTSFHAPGGEHGARPAAEPPFSSITLMLANASWQLAVTGGVAAIIVGVLVLAWPGETLVVVGALFAAYLLIYGVYQLAATFGRHVPGPMRALSFLSGAVSILLGLICLRGAAESILLLAFWIGIGWLLRGFSLLTQALAFDLPGRGWQIFLSAMTILAGIVTIVAPLASVLALTVLTGVWLLIIGASEIAHGIGLRRHMQRIA